MPVVFAPAEPVGEQIAAGYGATEQFNRSLPALSNLAESIARNRQAGSNAELAAQVQTNIASGQLAGQHEAQTAANDLHRYMQGQQIQAERQMQERRISAAQDAQFTDWALRGNAVSQQEVNHMQRLQNGISEVTQQVNSGQLTKEEGADLIVQMKTGISPIKNRLDQQHAELFQQQAAQTQRLKLENENAAHTQKFMLDAAKLGHTLTTMTDPTTGKVHMVGIDGKTGKIYNPFLEHESKGEAPQVQGEAGTFTTKAGGFDYAAAKKDATARAEADPAFINQETGKLNTDGHKWVQARTDGLEREWRQAKAGQAAPQAQQAPQAQSPDIQSMTANVQSMIETNPKLDGLAKSQALGTLSKAKDLIAKPMLTPEERKDLKDYLEYLKSVSK